VKRTKAKAQGTWLLLKDITRLGSIKPYCLWGTVPISIQSDTSSEGQPCWAYPKKGMDERQHPVQAKEEDILAKAKTSDESGGSPSLPLERTGKRDVRFGFWAALIAGFGGLIVLIALSGFEALDRARTISGRISEAYQNNLAVEKDLADIRSQLQTSAILVRDYLLDRSAKPYKGSPDVLLTLRKRVADEVIRLRGRIPGEDVPSLERMNREVQLYWSSLDPIFQWTPEQKIAKSSEFLRTRIPRRAAIMEIVSRIESLNQQTLAKQRQEVEERQQELPIFIRRSVLLTILLGFAIAGMSLYWINRLEKTSQQRKLEIEKAGYELRRLSQQLVHAQEEERKRISHELHDEVGQLLTGLRIELGNLDESGELSAGRSRGRLAETKLLAEQALRAVRDLAMGLRPAMLDELGLVPALQWQGREHSRRTGIPVSLEVEGRLDELPEEYRTCVYRVVQEALTNIAKHASARTILIGITARNEVLAISVKDDGVGFDAKTCGRGGLGLLGMAERVKKLKGSLEVVSQAGHGSSILAKMPLKEVAVAHEENSSVTVG
jgi:signal transduction histidine kinase